MRYTVNRYSIALNRYKIPNKQVTLNIILKCSFITVASMMCVSELGYYELNPLDIKMLNDFLIGKWKWNVSCHKNMFISRVINYV